MKVTLREAVLDDAPDIAELHELVWGRPSLTAEQWIQERQNQPEARYVVAEDSDTVVGFSSLTQPAHLLSTAGYRLRLLVHPEQERQGVGQLLISRMRQHWHHLQATDILTGTSETQLRAQTFLAHQGFREVIRFQDSELDLTCQLPLIPDLPAGIRILHLGELVALLGELPAWQAYHAVYEDTRTDIPRTTPLTPLPIEVMRRWSDEPSFFEEGVLFAVNVDGNILALTELRRTADPMVLDTGFTGTRREWRRQGLCRVLKLAAIATAQAQGAKKLQTTNASTNLLMLHLNQELGFEVRPAWIEFKLNLE